jgi:hypothetical protein
MPNKYDLKQTRGALRLARRFEQDPDRPTLPPLGGGGTRAGMPGPSTAGRIQAKWSAKSRRRMRFDFGALPWEMLGRRPVMITLTYPRDWEVWVPDSRALAKHREALRSRWQRKFGAPMGVWITEFQTRGAPHLHMYMALPDTVSETEYRGFQKRTMKRRALERQVGAYEARKQLRAPSGDFSTWLRTAWFEIVGSEDARHHGRGVDIAAAFFSDEAEASANRVRVADYFWRESGKWAQKNPPEGFGGLAYYGRWGGKQGFKPIVAETELSERVGLEIRRVMQRMMLGKRREVAKRYGRKVTPRESRSRGRDGLTVFGVDGTKVGPRLIDWAEQLVIDKETSAPSADHQRPQRFRPEIVRAFSEIQVDPETPPSTVDDEPPWFDEVDEHDAYAAHLGAIEREEALIEAEIDRLRQERERERRKEQRREENRKRGTRTTRNGSGGRRRPSGR